MTPTRWPKDFDREQIRNWLQDASGVGLSVADSLPDDLAATAEALGVLPAELRMWIFETPPHPWTPASLTGWARRNGLARSEAEAAAAVEPDTPESVAAKAQIERAVLDLFRREMSS